MHFAYLINIDFKSRIWYRESNDRYCFDHFLGKVVKKKSKAEPAKESHWTFLTNHAHILICLARNPDMVLKDVAAMVGVTERAVQRIVSELEQGGYIDREKDGRRNRYRLMLSKSLRHPVESNCDLRSLVNLIK